MNYSRYLPLTLADVIESGLGVSFTPEEIQRAQFSPLQFRDLSEAVRNYYDTYPLPEKPSWELRPYISPKFVAADELGAQFVSGVDALGQYSFDPSVKGQLTRAVKKYLLYAHSVCVHDRLPYLLDYFDLAPDSDHARLRIPAVQALLTEYAELGELLRSGILLLASPSISGPFEMRDIQPVYTTQLRVRLPDISEDDLKILEEVLRIQKSEKDLANDSIDFFFPTYALVRVLTELLAIAEQKFANSELYEPFKIGMLGSVQAINPDVISLRDITRIRMDDELFEAWRGVLSRILKRLHDERATYTDVERQMAQVAREEIGIWRQSLNERIKKSSFLQIISEAAVTATIGAIAGAAFESDPVKAVGEAGAIFAMQLIWGTVSSAKTRSRLRSVRTHFLSLGVDTE